MHRRSRSRSGTPPSLLGSRSLSTNSTPQHTSRPSTSGSQQSDIIPRMNFNDQSWQNFLDWQKNNPNVPEKEYGVCYKARYKQWLESLTSPKPPQPEPLRAPSPQPTIPYGQASVCKHKLHPGCPDKQATRCPVCWIAGALDVVHSAAKKWEALGGPTRDETLPNHMAFLGYKEAKLELVQLTHNFEGYAIAELKWEKQNAGLIRACGGFICANTSAMAVKKAQEDAPYIFKVSDPPKRPSLFRKRKRVSWANEIEDTPPRSSHEYHRGSPGYEPGRHACPSPDGWQDTSFAVTPKEDSSDDDDDDGGSGGKRKRGAAQDKVRRRLFRVGDEEGDLSGEARDVSLPPVRFNGKVMSYRQALKEKSKALGAYDDDESISDEDEDILPAEGKASPELGASSPIEADHEPSSDAGPPSSPPQALIQGAAVGGHAALLGLSTGNAELDLQYGDEVADWISNAREDDDDADNDNSSDTAMAD